jgi:hypothetical protein
MNPSPSAPATPHPPGDGRQVRWTFNTPQPSNRAAADDDKSTSPKPTAVLTRPADSLHPRPAAPPQPLLTYSSDGLRYPRPRVRGWAATLAPATVDLILAVQEENAEAVSRALVAGADVDVRRPDKHNATPLQLAALHTEPDCINALLSGPQKPALLGDDSGVTALHTCAEYTDGHLALPLLILAYGLTGYGHNPAAAATGVAPPPVSPPHGFITEPSIDIPQISNETIMVGTPRLGTPHPEPITSEISSYGINSPLAPPASGGMPLQPVRVYGADHSGRNILHALMENKAATGRVINSLMEWILRKHPSPLIVAMLNCRTTAGLTVLDLAILRDPQHLDPFRTSDLQALLLMLGARCGPELDRSRRDRLHAEEHEAREHLLREQQHRRNRIIRSRHAHRDVAKSRERLRRCRDDEDSRRKRVEADERKHFASIEYVKNRDFTTMIALEEQRREEFSATMIQSAWRGVKGRQTATLQRKRSHQRIRAATDIQRVYRGHRDRDYVKELRSKLKAAIVVQTLWRKFMAIGKRNELRRAYEATRSAAAMAILCVYRRRQVDRRVDKRRREMTGPIELWAHASREAFIANAVRLQCWWRMILIRRPFQVKKQACLVFQKHFRQRLEQKQTRRERLEEQAAKMIRQHCRREMHLRRIREYVDRMLKKKHKVRIESTTRVATKILFREAFLSYFYRHRSNFESMFYKMRLVDDADLRFRERLLGSFALVILLAELVSFFLFPRTTDDIFKPQFDRMALAFLWFRVAMSEKCLPLLFDVVLLATSTAGTFANTERAVHWVPAMCLLLMRVPLQLLRSVHDESATICNTIELSVRLLFNLSLLVIAVILAGSQVIGTRGELLTSSNNVGQLILNLLSGIVPRNALVDVSADVLPAFPLTFTNTTWNYTADATMPFGDNATTLEVEGYAARDMDELARSYLAGLSLTLLTELVLRLIIIASVCGAVHHTFKAYHRARMSILLSRWVDDADMAARMAAVAANAIAGPSSRNVWFQTRWLQQEASRPTEDKLRPPYDCTVEAPVQQYLLDTARAMEALATHEPFQQQKWYFHAIKHEWTAGCFSRMGHAVVLFNVIVTLALPTDARVEYTFSAFYTAELLLSLVLAPQVCLARPAELLVRVCNAGVGFIAPLHFMCPARAIRLTCGLRVYWYPMLIHSYGFAVCVYFGLVCYFVSAAASYQGDDGRMLDGGHLGGHLQYSAGQMFSPRAVRTDVALFEVISALFRRFVVPLACAVIAQPVLGLGERAMCMTREAIAILRDKVNTYAAAITESEAWFEGRKVPRELKPSFVVTLKHMAARARKRVRSRHRTANAAGHEGLAPAIPDLADASDSTAVYGLSLLSDEAKMGDVFADLKLKRMEKMKEERDEAFRVKHRRLSRKRTLLPHRVESSDSSSSSSDADDTEASSPAKRSRSRSAATASPRTEVSSAAAVVSPRSPSASPGGRRRSSTRRKSGAVKAALPPRPLPAPVFTRYKLVTPCSNLVPTILDAPIILDPVSTLRTLLAGGEVPQTCISSALSRSTTLHYVNLIVSLASVVLLYYPDMVRTTDLDPTPLGVDIVHWVSIFTSALIIPRDITAVFLIVGLPLLLAATVVPDREVHYLRFVSVLRIFTWQVAPLRTVFRAIRRAMDIMVHALPTILIVVALIVSAVAMSVGPDETLTSRQRRQEMVNRFNDNMAFFWASAVWYVEPLLIAVCCFLGLAATPEKFTSTSAVIFQSVLYLLRPSESSPATLVARRFSISNVFFFFANLVMISNFVAICVIDYVHWEQFKWIELASAVVFVVHSVGAIFAFWNLPMIQPAPPRAAPSSTSKMRSRAPQQQQLSTRMATVLQAELLPPPCRVDHTALQLRRAFNFILASDLIITCYVLAAVLAVPIFDVAPQSVYTVALAVRFIRLVHFMLRDVAVGILYNIALLFGSMTLLAGFLAVMSSMAAEATDDFEGSRTRFSALILATTTTLRFPSRAIGLYTASPIVIVTGIVARLILCILTALVALKMIPYWIIRLEGLTSRPAALYKFLTTGDEPPATIDPEPATTELEPKPHSTTGAAKSQPNTPPPAPPLQPRSAEENALIVPRAITSQMRTGCDWRLLAGEDYIARWQVPFMLEGLKLMHVAHQRHLYRLVLHLVDFLAVLDERARIVESVNRDVEVMANGGPSDGEDFAALPRFPPDVSTVAGEYRPVEHDRDSESENAMANADGSVQRRRWAVRAWGARRVIPNVQFKASAASDPRRVRVVPTMRLVQALQVVDSGFPASSSHEVRMWNAFLWAQRKVVAATMLQSLWRMHVEIKRVERGFTRREKVSITILRRKQRNATMQLRVQLFRRRNLAEALNTAPLVFNTSALHYDFCQRLRFRWEDLCDIREAPLTPLQQSTDPMWIQSTALAMREGSPIIPRYRGNPNPADSQDRAARASRGNDSDDGSGHEESSNPLSGLPPPMYNVMNSSDSAGTVAPTARDLMDNESFIIPTLPFPAGDDGANRSNSGFVPPSSSGAVAGALSTSVSLGQRRGFTGLETLSLTPHALGGAGRTQSGSAAAVAGGSGTQSNVAPMPSTSALLGVPPTPLRGGSRSLAEIAAGSRGGAATQQQPTAPMNMPPASPAALEGIRTALPDVAMQPPPLAGVRPVTPPTQSSTSRSQSASPSKQSQPSKKSGHAAAPSSITDDSDDDDDDDNKDREGMSPSQRENTSMPKTSKPASPRT